jgi:hypothetical protein
MSILVIEVEDLLHLGISARHKARLKAADTHHTAWTTLAAATKSFLFDVWVIRLHVEILSTLIDSESVTTVLKYRNNITFALSVGLGCRSL